MSKRSIPVYEDTCPSICVITLTMMCMFIFANMLISNPFWNFALLPAFDAKRRNGTNSSLWKTGCEDSNEACTRVLKLAKSHATDSKDRNEPRFYYCIAQSKIRISQELENVLFDGKAQYICERKKLTGSNKAFRLDR